MTIVIWPHPKEWGTDIFLPSMPPEWLGLMRGIASGAEIITPETDAEALAAAPKAEAWIGRLTPAMFSVAKKLRWVQSPTIGVETLLFPELIDSNVTITNMRYLSHDHVANHVLALFLALCRELPRLWRRQLQHEWGLPNQRLRDPAGMTVLIMGLGAIGIELIRRFAAMSTTIIGVDPKVLLPPFGVKEVANPERLPELLPQVDTVAICAPATPQTVGLFDEAMFKKMRPDAFFINVGRGEIVKLSALERALREGWIAGAGLDVFETEPLPKDSALWEMENVIITSHTGGTGPHGEERRVLVVNENLRRFVTDEPLLTVVDKKQWY